jgi:hypothetical protein
VSEAEANRALVALFWKDLYEVRDFDKISGYFAEKWWLERMLGHSEADFS